MTMSTAPPAYKAHRCSFHPDRQDQYLRLSAVTVFVRDQDRSLRFYLDQLGFSLALDTRLPSGDRLLTVTPPDGTATLALVAPKPHSEEHKLIGRSTQIVFMTEDVSAKFEEWRQRGVRFRCPPQVETWGAISTSFEDLDGNSFTLLAYNELTREVEAQRRAHAERLAYERRAEEEQAVARQVQAKLFPQTQPTLTTLEYGGICIQAREVGGDYYDFLDLGRERAGLVIGDVSGKGTAAALLMANLQAHVRELCAAYSARPYTPFALEQPQRFLIALNRVFYESTTDNAYATFLFAEYDDSLRRLRYANCGHLPALLFRHDGNLERLDSTCGILGLSKEWDCTVGERDLFPGDTLVFYTDGVTESFNDAEEEFGEQRLIESLRKYCQNSSHALLASLLEDVRQFSLPEQHDDITLIVAKCG
jgi:phosphoserine phosphatase RsbU/P